MNDNRNRFLRALASAFCVSLIVGCATPQSSERTTRVEITAPSGQPPGARVQVVDVRDQGSRIDRASKSGTPTFYLGDLAFVPSPREIVSAHLVQGLPNPAGGATPPVELKRFDVGLMTPTGPRPRYTQWVPGGLGGALIYEGLRAALDRGLTTAYAEIVVGVAGRDYSGLDFANLDAGYTPEQALALVVANALRHLNRELDEAARQRSSSNTPASAPPR